MSDSLGRRSHHTVNTLHHGHPPEASSLTEALNQKMDLFDSEDEEGARPWEAATGRLSPATSLVVQVLILVTLWWIAAIEVVFVIKSVVGSKTSEGSFPYPFALTALTNGCTALLALGLHHLMAYLHPGKGPPRTPLRRSELLKLLLIGLIQGVEIACNNKSLEFLSVSVRTMLNSTSTLFTMAFAKLWGLERLGPMRLASALLLTAGGVCQGLDSSAGKTGEAELKYLHGVAIQVIALIMGAQRWALVQMVTQRSPRGSALAAMTKLELAAWIMPVTAAVCAVLAVIFEPESLRPSLWMRWSLQWRVMAMALGIVTLTASELRIVHITSAVAMNVLATLHQIPIVFAGVVLFSDRVGFKSAIGFGCCICGALYYVRARQLDAETAPVDVSKHQCLDAMELQPCASSPRTTKPGYVSPGPRALGASLEVPSCSIPSRGGIASDCEDL